MAAISDPRIVVTRHPNLFVIALAIGPIPRVKPVNNEIITDAFALLASNS